MLPFLRFPTRSTQPEQPVPHLVVAGSPPLLLERRDPSHALGAGVPAGVPLRSATLLERPPVRRTVRLGALVTAVALVGGLLLPWQQSVQGRGEVTALDPADRPQQVPSVIDGRIAEWLVAEGARVARGTPLVRIAEVNPTYLDPALLERQREQLAAKQGSVAAKQEKAEALAEQAAALEQGLVLAGEKARNQIALTRASVEAALADSAVAADQLERRERLQRDGLVSLNDLQSARLRLQQAVAKLVERRQVLASAEIELRAVGAEYGEKLAKTRAERSATLAEVSDGTGEVAKLRNTTDALQTRSDFQVIRAPQDGYVVQAVRAGVGEQVKAGDPVVSIMPATPKPAVAIAVTATDVPLLAVGRKVRLQFDGWPALQFSGWPSVAVGTFGGEIAVIDQVARADGTYRVLVRPDPRDEPWPTQLRQGSGVLAWAMLDEVSVGYEFWRRLNGFPPALRSGATASTDKAQGAKR